MTVLRKLIFIVVFLLLLFGQQSLRGENTESIKKQIPAKTSVTFHNLTKSKDGLIDNIINDIVQDKRGHIWIASNEGLSRYDGHRFISVFDGYLQGVSIDDTNIEELAIDKSGTLWILTSSAIHRYDDKQAQFQTVLKKGDSFGENLIATFLSMDITAEGELWIVTDRGLLRLLKGGVTFQRYEKKSKKFPAVKPRRVFVTELGGIFIGGLEEGLWSYQSDTDSFVQFIQNISVLDKDAKFIRAIKSTVAGHYWGLSDNGLLQFDTDGNILKWLNHENTSWLKKARLRELAIDTKNNLAITSKGVGIYYLDSTGKLLNRIINKIGESQTLLSNNTNRLYLDRENILWIGTGNDGISLWNKQTSFLQRIEFDVTNQDGLIDGKIWSIFQDSQNRLWIGTDKGLNLWDASQQKFIYFNLGEMRSEDAAYVLAIIETADGIIWLSTGLGLMSLNPTTGKITNYKTDKISDKGLFSDYIFGLFVDSRERLWIGYEKGLSYLDPDSKQFIHLNKNSFNDHNLTSNEVGSITEDAAGNIWIGTSKGICKYNYNIGNFDCKIKEYGGKTPKDTYLVNALLADKGSLWVGYSGNGLLKLDSNSSDDKFKEFKTGKGFPSNNVSSILRDKQGRLWMSSQSGLVVFEPKDNTYTVIEAKDGLGNSEFNESAYTRLNDGRFAFGTVNGVVIVDPEKFQVSDKISEVVLSGIYSLSDQRRIIDIDNIRLPEEKSGLKINFSNLNYFYPEQSRYQYKLGKHKNWIDLGNESEILFAESTSGKHNIHIRSKYLGGEWGPEEVVHFSVYPPLWRNNHLLTLYVLFAILGIVLFFRYRQQRLIEKYEMLGSLEKNEAQFRLSLDASEQGVWDWKAENDVMTRGKTQELLHMDVPATLVKYWALIQDVDRLNVIKCWNAHLFGKEKNYHCQYRIEVNGEEIWVEEQGRSSKQDKYGMATHVSGTYRNITRTKSIEKNLNLLAKAFEDTAEGMLIIDKKLNIVQVNHAVTEITGFRAKELIGNPISSSSEDVLISFFDDIWLTVTEKGLWQGEVYQKNSENEDIPLWLNASKIKNDDDETYYVLIISDMSERKATEEELRYLANYDILTKLPNRALLRDRLDHALSNSKRQNQPLAILFLDLDRFKNVNDSFGHAVGDGLLVVVADRLKDCLREDDTVSRLGGDEFVILMEHFSTINAIAAVTEKIRVAMMQPFRLEGVDIQSSFSIGVSVFPNDGEDSATLLRNADTAMYHAKSKGRNRVQFYAPKMNERALERLTLENDLRTAIGSGQLEVYFQPQVRSGDGSLYGAEALIRWNHPEKGFLTPFHFIPMAEESDLIVSLGNEVLYKACVQMQKWQEEFGLELRISINLAARQMLQVGLALHIENVVQRAGLSPSVVTLEITETAVMEDLERARKVLDTLRAKGFKIAIDDFGTGYSSLNYLRNIPLDIIKIDYSFVKELLDNTVDQAIVAAIIEIGAALDLEVLAEGIETVEQETMLLEKGCRLYQGYLFGKPMPADEFTTLIESSIAEQKKKGKKTKIGEKLKHR